MTVELVVNNILDAESLVETLTNNGYVCMVSREENLYIVNAVWSQMCDRNDVVFMSREEFEMNYVKVEEDGSED